jgi:hypothetical protein
VIGRGKDHLDPRPIEWPTPEGAATTWTSYDHPVDQVAIDRFWAKVDKTSDHWYWRGAKNMRGEGQVRIDGTLHATHRVAWELEHGPLAPGLRLRTCDEPNCVRSHPDHVHVGAKLASVDIIAIRASSQSQRSIAADYGVSQQMVAKIRSGRAWAHVA